jgi:formiminoglutamate deiminase
MDATFHCALAWLGGERPEADVLVEVTGDRFAAITRGVPAPPAAVRFRGLTLPGFANAHSHAFHRALRGRTHAGRGSFWNWREQMYSVAGGLDPDTYLALARATYAEMALAGITCVGEFHYLHHAPDGRPYADPAAMGAALCAAAADAGVRLTLIDACYLHGGIGGARPEGPQRRFTDGSAEAWVTRAAARDHLASATVRLGVAAHSVRAVDPEAIRIVGQYAHGEGLPLHAHVSEQPAENAACVEEYGRTPTELLAELDVVDAAFTAVHATHLTDADIAVLGESGCTACFCPTTERDLADGIGPAARLAAAGVRLALGTDSHAVVDMFEEARALELHERLETQMRGHFTAEQLLAAATAAGHRALGWPDAGRIEVGALADLVVVDLASVRTAGTDPAAIAFTATAADVREVVCGGRHVVTAGTHMSIDVPAELASAIAAVMP